MTIQEVNAKTLSNGMNRKDYFDSVADWCSQGPIDYNGYFVKKLNIPYDTASDRQKYDVYMPMKPGLYPTVLLVHGGGWFTGDRSDFGLSLVLPYIAHGFTVITVWQTKPFIPSPSTMSARPLIRFFPTRRITVWISIAFPCRQAPQAPPLPRWLRCSAKM